MKDQLNLFSESQVSKGAVVSDCGLYRFQLWRLWNESLPKVLFIMHNPSKANEKDDDPTIRRCIGFAKSWGYGGFYVGNLSPFRSTDPKLIQACSPEIRSSNQWHCDQMRAKCEIVVWAHGVPSKNVWISDVFLTGPTYFLKKTKDGHPYHPLFLPKNITPTPFAH